MMSGEFPQTEKDNAVTFITSLGALSKFSSNKAER
jgi:tellurite resistance protein